MSTQPRIKTTVVGSYPVPDWLVALPSEQALADATRVVIHTQEQAGIDLVCDGELSRFDVNHPETNGMIEYFVKPMAGIRTAVTFDELVAYRAQKRHGVPHAPAGGGGWRRSGPARSICRGLRARQSGSPRGRSSSPLPARTCWPRPCSISITGTCPISRWRLPMRWPRRSRISTRTWCSSTKPTCPAARTNGNGRRRRSTACCDAVKTKPAVHLCFGNYGGQSIQKGNWGKLIDYLNALHVDHIVMENAHRPTEELARVPRAAAGDRLRARRDRHQVDRDRNAPTRSRARSSGRKRARRRAREIRASRTADSGCSSARSPTARSARWWRGATCLRRAAASAPASLQCIRGFRAAG